MPTPLEALTYAKRFVGNVVIDATELKYRVLNDAWCKLWMAAPWSWSLNTDLLPLTLANSTGSYTVAAVTPTVLIARLESCKIYDGQDLNDLRVVPRIGAAWSTVTSAVGRPTHVSYNLVDASNSVWKVFPVPTGYVTLPTLLGILKLRAPEMNITTAAQQVNEFGFPFEWFWVFQEMVLLKTYQFTNNPRLGSITVLPGGGVQYSGQYGVVAEAIAFMKDQELKYRETLGTEVKSNG